MSVTAREELHEVADLYRKVDATEKEATKAKGEIRPALLELMDEVVFEELPRATRVEEEVDLSGVPEGIESLDDAVEWWRARNFPQWEVKGIVLLHTEDQELYTVTLEENSSLQKFSFVHDGYTYGRTVSMVNSNFDCERFLLDIKKKAKAGEITKEECNELDDLIKETVSLSLDETKARKLIADKPGVAHLLQQYASPGEPQVRLNPIRKAKEEEVDG